MYHSTTNASEQLTTEFHFNVQQINSDPLAAPLQYHPVITVLTYSQETEHPL
jgi:hypothetical protein